MSDNVCGSGDLHVNAYIKQGGLVLQPPMNLGPEFGQPPKDLAEAEIHYHIDVIREDGNSAVLRGYEAVLASIFILKDALQRDAVLNTIQKPSREELETLRAAIDKIKYFVPHESKHR